MPEPKSMLEATSEANNLASLSESKETYMRGMEEVCGAEKPFINEHVLEIEHLRIRDTALEVFNGRRKMGGEEFSLKYREKLETEINEAFENFKLCNDNKNIFKAANTPITLAAVAMLCYVASQILGKFKESEKKIFTVFENLFLFYRSNWIISVRQCAQFSNDGRLPIVNDLVLRQVLGKL